MITWTFGLCYGRSVDCGITREFVCDEIVEEKFEGTFESMDNRNGDRFVCSRSDGFDCDEFNSRDADLIDDVMNEVNQIFWKIIKHRRL